MVCIYSLGDPKAEQQALEEDWVQAAAPELCS